MTCSLSMFPMDKYFLVPIQSYSDGESYSGEACGIEVETFEEYLSEVDTWGVLCDEYGNYH